MGVFDSHSYIPVSLYYGCSASSGGLFGNFGGRRHAQNIKSRLLEFASQPDHRSSFVALDYSLLNDR